MRKFIVLFSILLSFAAMAQTPSMTVSSVGNYQNPYWMAENILCDSSLTPYNIGANGFPLTQANTTQIGYFQANDTTFPIQSGIVMVAATNANDVINTPGYGNDVTFTDSELASVLTTIGSSSTTQKDIVQIQFSFYAQTDTIKFNYCFGSHEYDGYTCSNFNDVFGFFLEGPMIDGVTPPTGQNTIVKNIAVIPGTTVPIAVNTVNSGQPANNSTCLAANPNYMTHSAYFNQSNGTITTLDGYTDKFTAQAYVQCGSWYTIRLKLCNVSDNWLSSAVFLEEGSLAGPTIAIDDTSASVIRDSMLVEGCEPRQLIFTRDKNINHDMKIPLETRGNAISGVDYSPLPDTVYLPAGVKSDTVSFWIYDDNVSEGIDTLEIVQDLVFTSCFDYPRQYFTYYIRDKDSLQGMLTSMAPSDTVACAGDSVRLFVTTTDFEGSYGGYWEGDAMPDSTRTLIVDSDTTFTYVLYDECGDTLRLSHDFFVAPYDPMVYERDTVRVCPGDSAYVNPQIVDGVAPVQFTWDIGTNNPQRATWPTADTNYYEFQTVDGCDNILIDSAVTIRMPRPSAGFQYMNDPYVPLRVSFTERASNEVSWTWYVDTAVITGQEFEYDFPYPGDYQVQQVVVSDFGCVDSITLNVSVETDFYLYVPTAFTPNNDGYNECFHIKGVGFESFEIQIFNRWGNPVFTGGKDDCWDGTVNGKDVVSGIYTYRLFARLPFDEIYIKEGTLNVIR
jgi:gliding motility-associated-like protein